MATRRLVILKARPGSVRNGRFTPRKARNVSDGFMDAGGVFHPIRSSSDYSASRAGETKSKKRKPAKKPKAKKPAKKKTAPRKATKKRPAKKATRKTARRR
jgi:hypothetical protein